MVNTSDICCFRKQGTKRLANVGLSTETEQRIPSPQPVHPTVSNSDFALGRCPGCTWCPQRSQESRSRSTTQGRIRFQIVLGTVPKREQGHPLPWRWNAQRDCRCHGGTVLRMLEKTSIQFSTSIKEITPSRGVCIAVFRTS